MFPALSYSLKLLRNDWRGRWALLSLLWSPRRLLTMLCEHVCTEPFDPRAQRFGNYCLFPHLIRTDAVVYSFGVGGDIDFDLALVERYGCTVHCFDPSPLSIAFMERHRGNPHIVFIPQGVWIEDGSVKLFSNVDGKGVTNGSITNLYGQKMFTTIACQTIESFMRELGHIRIDVLKMDIEGAALPILLQMLRGPVRPTQIIVELERPQQMFSWMREVRQLFAQLKREGYRVIRLPRSHKPYRSLEILCVRTLPIPSPSPPFAKATAGRRGEREFFTERRSSLRGELGDRQ